MRIAPLKTKKEEKPPSEIPSDSEDEPDDYDEEEKEKE